MQLGLDKNLAAFATSQIRLVHSSDLVLRASGDFARSPQGCHKAKLRKKN